MNQLRSLLSTVALAVALPTAQAQQQLRPTYYLGWAEEYSIVFLSGEYMKYGERRLVPSYSSFEAAKAALEAYKTKYPKSAHIAKIIVIYEPYGSEGTAP